MKINRYDDSSGRIPVGDISPGDAFKRHPAGGIYLRVHGSHINVDSDTAREGSVHAIVLANGGKLSLRKRELVIAVNAVVEVYHKD